MQTGHECPYCGFTQHSEEANYCGMCGKPIRFFQNKSASSQARVLCAYLFDKKDERDLSTLSRPLSAFNENGEPNYSEISRLINSEYNKYPIEFTVVKNNVLTDVSGILNSKYRLTDEKSYKLQQIVDYVTKENKSAGKLFGGKSKTDILNAIEEIIRR